MIHKTAANGTAFPAKISPPPPAEPFFPGAPPPLPPLRQRRSIRTHPLRRKKTASDSDGKMFPRSGGPAWFFLLPASCGGISTQRAGPPKNAPGNIVPGASVSHLSFSHVSLSVPCGARALRSAPSRTVPFRCRHPHAPESTLSGAACLISSRATAPQTDSRRV